METRNREERAEEGEVWGQWNPEEELRCQGLGRELCPGHSALS